MVYPTEGEVFELTIDGNAPENQPEALLRSFGLKGYWTHKGITVPGKQTGLFELVSSGFCSTLEEVRSVIGQEQLLEPQWIRAFKAAYPEPDGRGPIGIATVFAGEIPNGEDPDNPYCLIIPKFPAIGTDGVTYLHWTRNSYLGNWRWLRRIQ